MGTSNFYAKNASKYFVIPAWTEDSDIVELNDYDPENLPYFIRKTDTGYEVFDEEGYNVTDVKDWIEEILKEKKIDFKEIDGDDGSRNYSLNYWFDIHRRFKFAGETFYITIFLGYRPGYYEAGNLDYEVYYEANDQYDEVDSDLCEDLLYDIHCDNRLKFLAPKLCARFEKERAILEAQVEEICGQVTTAYVCTARFSNGEAWYSKADSLDAAVNG